MSELKTTHKWKDIKWRKIERQVWKLQKRIFRASQRGDKSMVRKLQKLLMKSWAAKCLAVRRVTQDNQGKKTAGVDGVKKLTLNQRLDLVKAINIRDGIRKVRPTRRVWIPKPGKAEKQPLGIPTMYDRSMQALVKMAIEPEWEAKFESNSYGFRPGRSCHDAIQAIYGAVRQKSKYVLDADISKCFDGINHQALLKKLDTYPTVQNLIKAWLEAGVIDDRTYSETTEGTPQGGVISPLLANIALHGIETFIRNLRIKGVVNSTNPVLLIRYADDFVVMHESLEVIQRCQGLIDGWLADMSLELKPSKTRICHTLNKVEDEEPGFEFLGFHIQQHLQGKNHSGKRVNGESLGFKTIITPSKAAIKAHYDKIATVIESHKAATQEQLINRLNPIIGGWSNYYRTQCSSLVYKELDMMLFHKLWRWAEYRHPKKTKKWVANRYWKTVKTRNWVFGTEELTLLNHSDTKIIRHERIKDHSSPYDGNSIYWGKRLGKHPTLPRTKADLLKRQNGKCDWCNTYFKLGDLLETDHKIPRSQGGRQIRINLQLLHRHCHDEKTLADYRRVDKEWLDAKPW